MNEQPVNDPTTKYHTDGFPPRETPPPGLTKDTVPTPDHGENSYRGAERLTNRRVLITGGDSGIGRAVAIAFAREGADIAIGYLPQEQADAEATKEWVERAGRKALLIPGDVKEQDHNQELVDRTVEEFGGLDIVIANAAYQRSRPDVDELDADEFDQVIKTNLYGTFWLVKAALPHLAPGSSVIVTSSIQGFNPSDDLIDYAMTKAALVSFVQSLAAQQGKNGIRVNAVAPGPIWTPLIPATGWPDKLPKFGQDTPLGRAGQPAELAGAYVYLASEDASYVSGTVLAVTGGKHL